MVLSTSFETYSLMKGNNEKTSKFRQLLQSFSIIASNRLLFEKNTRFASLDTIRLLLIINVYVLHIYLFTSTIGIISLKNIYNSVPKRLLFDNKYFFVRNNQIVVIIVIKSIVIDQSNNHCSSQ